MSTHLAAALATARATLARCDAAGWPFAAPKREGE
jgi:hypothetical protein